MDQQTPKPSTTEALKQASKRKAEQANDPSAPRPLLEINMLAPIRPYITVDDKRHDFKLVREFGLLEHQEFTRDSDRYDYLWQKGIDGAEAAGRGSAEDREPSGEPVPPLSDAEQHELLELQEKLFRQTLIDPDKLVAQIAGGVPGAMQREILLTFTNAPLLTEMARQRAMEEAAQETSSTTAS